MPELMYLPPPGRARRSFLRKGFWGTVLLALAGSGGALFLRRSRVKQEKTGLRILSSFEYATLAAFAERLIPDKTGFPTARSLDIALVADGLLLKTDPTVQDDVKRLLRLFENALANALFGSRFRPFTELNGIEQDQVLSEWEQSRLLLRRSGFQALRTLCFAAYYGNAQTWARVGYPGPPPGFVEPNAPVWKGGSVPRPPGLEVRR